MNEEFDFTNEIDKASWELLKPHHERGAVFVVANNLELAQVAKALALPSSSDFILSLLKRDASRFAPYAK